MAGRNHTLLGQICFLRVLFSSSVLARAIGLRARLNDKLFA
jgi:hypothetical protein